MSDRIITSHVSPYVAIQGYERDLPPVPNPMASFEDTTHAYECGYRDGAKTDAKPLGVHVMCCSSSLKGIAEGDTRQCRVCGSRWTLDGVASLWGDAQGPRDPRQRTVGQQPPQGTTPDQRGVLKAKDLLSEWLETPNEGDAMVDCLLGVIREAHAALGGEA